ncbi:hypothetical protein I4F81_002225 [Pyropia yezoensis]|uniref:Uncharacterized protein n=1 Tax=Pyropia yezoensis TaxID=2788 RepID=A0ACC3BPG8_PYRYE|nr:hypothetical protein I4F81_002225 [Neopyropia yezoensis]
MAFKTVISVAAVALALVATAGSAAAVPARGVARQALVGGAPQLINVDVKKEKKEGQTGGVQLVSGLTGIGQPQLVQGQQQLGQELDQ